jgi:site-specific DNA-methyltransferase (cytosine-N4-specific)
VAPQNLEGITQRALEELGKLAAVHGYPSPEAYLEALAVRTDTIDQILAEARGEPLTRKLSTDLGEIYQGNALTYTQGKGTGSVDLIMTSPPFGLVRKKAYGNEASEAYCDWFRPFAIEFHRILKDSGSLVIDIGGAWEKGKPVRSLYHFDLLIMLVKEYGFHLCLEHYWWNPSKLPSPAEWVNVRRVRPKDAVNTIWWLSKTPWPKSSNRRVIGEYSDSMKGLLKNGYKAKLRPSGHDISENFSKGGKGSIPPNLLAIANTESNSAYAKFCRVNNIPIHPARFPPKLPEYFIRMLTDPSDLVFDPFSGSFMTARVAEELGRNWAGTELEPDYVAGGMARFKDDAPCVLLESGRTAKYEILAPCSLGDTDDVPMPLDGGLKRPEKKSGTQAEIF